MWVSSKYFVFGIIFKFNASNVLVLIRLSQKLSKEIIGLIRKMRIIVIFLNYWKNKSFYYRFQIFRSGHTLKSVSYTKSKSSRMQNLENKNSYLYGVVDCLNYLLNYSELINKKNNDENNLKLQKALFFWKCVPTGLRYLPSTNISRNYKNSQSLNEHWNNTKDYKKAFSS